MREQDNNEGSVVTALVGGCALSSLEKGDYSDIPKVVNIDGKR